MNRRRPVSRAYLLDILLSTEVPVDPAIGGIPVDLRGKVSIATRDEARTTLIAMAREYERAGDRPRAAGVRRAVLRTRNHLKLALSRPMRPDRHESRREIDRWMRVWLEAPSLFEAWLDLREARPRCTRAAVAPSGRDTGGPGRQEGPA